ncbi:selina-4(15),7(11)-diene synthase [Streptomyces sp. TP-A0874]|uniref:selina-4(15),7(11)-diene synthase n=1 Tax=Streptomyces sp. TP-A0874 TaxID=549819 RepID=UPI001FCE02B3|nr:selina-4(15),7(11)-diene synthase [Streptomyces sp. TP-A0874]
MTVPEIYSPLPPAIHPRHAEIDAQTSQWAHEFKIGSEDLRSRLIAHDIGTFAARILPEGDEGAVSIIADFILWLFGVDDGHCEEGDLGTRPGELAGELSRLLRVAQDPQAPLLPDDPLADGLRDLRLRLGQYATDSQIARWVDALREYSLSVAWEAAHRAAGTVPSLSDYTLMRLYDGATSVIYPLLEMGRRYELRQEERDRRTVRAISEMSSFIIAWDNDIFSHHKESRSSGYYLNAIRVLEHHENLDPGTALSVAIRQRDSVMAHFLYVRDRLLQDASPELVQYLESLGHFIRGAQDWGISSHRYTTPEDPADLPTAFSSSFADTNQAPLDIPVISHWWDPDLFSW